jgi:hypothetical protein
MIMVRMDLALNFASIIVSEKSESNSNQPVGLIKLFPASIINMHNIATDK